MTRVASEIILQCCGHVVVVRHLIVLGQQGEFHGCTPDTQKEVTISSYYRLGLGRRPWRWRPIDSPDARLVVETPRIFVSETCVGTGHVPTRNPGIPVLDGG